MKIQEFIKDRNVSYQAVRKYVVSHSEFEGHIGRPNNIILDDVAVELLEQKYPSAAVPLQVIQDNAAREKLQQLSEKYIGLLEENNRLTQENANLMLLQHKQLFLEEQTQELKAKLSRSESIFESLKEEYETLYEQNDKLKEQLAVERQKTWWDKLRGR